MPITLLTDLNESTTGLYQSTDFTILTDFCETNNLNRSNQFSLLSTFRSDIIRISLNATNEIFCFVYLNVENKSRNRL